MDWLGHQDSKMVRYYYHLSDQRSQDEMARLEFVNRQDVKGPSGPVAEPGLESETVAAGA